MAALAAPGATEYVPQLGDVRDASAVGVEQKTERRDQLRQIEQKIQARWAQNRTFECDAPAVYDRSDPATKNQGKFFATFPYPYMNGKIHLGHTFTVTKADFAAGYQMLKGKRVLFPFAFHCTGMPIQAAANKLKREIETFGVENCKAGLFETAEERAAAAEAARLKAAAKEESGANLGKFKGKKTKLVAKTGVARQWQILVASGVPEDEIPAFVDAEHWLRYFPPYGQRDLTSFGLHTDWRRSFITTSTNPYYDSFVRWQFTTLRKRNVIGFGNRPTIYSIDQGQACADHARSEGEGTGPQEYTLIKIRVLDTADLCARVGCDAAELAGRVVYLVAATLRPETMYGQTNVFVLPTGEYGMYAMKDGEVFVCSKRSVVNMSFQNMTEATGEVVSVGEPFQGRAILGIAVQAPNAVHPKVYCLPLLSISMGKGTGVVTSVPSDAPDDYIALRDLQRNEGNVRDEYGITEEMCAFDVVPIITIPGGDEDLGIESWGPCSAVTGCEVLKVKNQHDSKKLIKIKKSCYNKGFYQGVMEVGSQKGCLVKDAKAAVRAEMLAAGTAAVYWEPESLVVSRNGDECVVAFVDQWYLSYGEESWRDRVMGHVTATDSFSAFSDASLKQYVKTLNWLGTWACSRNFGLGTQLPWDEQFVIESLSDSTIYMSYYTIAHLLQGRDNVDGKKVGPSGLRPEDMTLEAWDYVYLGGAAQAGWSEATTRALDSFKHEFEYWYPMDLRVSGKDLVRNHLTMSLYNHAAIWQDRPELWPRGFFTNGHVMVDGAKMSKSKGNFVTLSDGLGTDNVRFDGTEWKSQSWSADSVRIALADAGDSNEDANFETETANMAILRLTTDLFFIDETRAAEAAGELRPADSPMTLMDRVFTARMNEYVLDGDVHFSNMQFKMALKSVFYEMKNARDQYVNYHKLAEERMHAGVLRRWIESSAVMMSPISSHMSEHVWMDLLGNETSVTKATWPSVVEVDPIVPVMFSYVTDTISNFRSSLAPPKSKKKKKAKTAAEAAPFVPPTQAYVYVETEYPAWRMELLAALKNIFEANGKSFPKTTIKELMPVVQASELLKAEGKMLLKVAAFIVAEVKDRGESALQAKMPFDELTVLEENKGYIGKMLGLESIEFFHARDADAKVFEGAKAGTREAALPGAPTIVGYA